MSADGQAKGGLEPIKQSKESVEKRFLTPDKVSLSISTNSHGQDPYRLTRCHKRSFRKSSDL